MEAITHNIINKNSLIKKFCFYGFLKNLTFFEPYLLIFLTGNGISLFQIGFLISIREIIVMIFEVPSGIIADYVGRKKELYICFCFYILSFVFFFFSTSFMLCAFAMIFFGLGKAFRSGTHKAMIYSYLEEKNWQEYKTFVYGKTRSASLLGSAISSLLGIAIILNVPQSNYIFLASTIPYLIDFFLILSYPKSLDKSLSAKHTTIKEFLALIKNSLFKKKQLRHILTANAVFEAIMSTSKDLIQPILSAIIVGTGVLLFSSTSSEDNLAITLGLVYTFLNVFSSLASANAYHIKKLMGRANGLNIFYLLLIATLFLLGIGIHSAVAVCVLYTLMYLWQNMRKPLFVDKIDESMQKEERATMLSISSQLTAIFVIILAPLVGWIGDTYGMASLMYALAGFVLLLYPFSRVKKLKIICKDFIALR